MATEAIKIPFVEAAAPATPAAGRAVVYAKADGLMYSKDDAGVETLMSSGVSLSNPMTSVGDIIQGTTAGATQRLASPLAGKVLTGAGLTTSVAYNYPPGYEFNYVEVTTDTSITATTEATAQAIVTSGSITYDGSTIILIQAWSPFATAGTGGTKLIFGVLWDDTAGASIGKAPVMSNRAATGDDYGVWAMTRRLTPANGARVYSFRAYASVATGTVAAGAGGVGNYLPGFIRITKVSGGA